LKFIKYILIILLSLGVFYLLTQKEKVEQLSLTFKNTIILLQDKLEITQNNTLNVNKLNTQIQILNEKIAYKNYQIEKLNLVDKDKDYQLYQKEEALNKLRVTILEIEKKTKKKLNEISQKTAIIRTLKKNNARLVKKINQNKATKLDLTIPFKTADYDKVIKTDIKNQNYSKPEALSLEENINKMQIIPSIEFNEEKEIDSLNIKVKTKF
jgi:hypothetical protein